MDIERKSDPDIVDLTEEVEQPVPIQPEALLARFQEFASTRGLIDIADLERRLRPIFIKLINRISDEPISMESSWDELDSCWYQLYLKIVSETWPQESPLFLIFRERLMMVQGKIARNNFLIQDGSIKKMAEKLGITTDSWIG